MDYQPISEKEEQIASAIVDSAYAVHSALGPGLLENIYEVCFCHELTKRGMKNRRQVVVPLVYDGITFDAGLREVKAKPTLLGRFSRRFGHL